MQRYRAGVVAVADDCKHLPPRSALAACDEFGEQRSADATSMEAILDVHRVFHREAISGSRAIEGRIAVAHDAPVELGDEIGQAELQDGRAARRHLIERR